MTIDALARTATESLLARTTPDTGAWLAELKRTRRHRSVARAFAAGAVVVATVGAMTVLGGGNDAKPEPAAPTYRNGPLLVAGEDLRVVYGDGAGLELPDGYWGDGGVAFTPDGSELLYNNRSQRIEAIDLATGQVRLVGPCGEGSSCPTALSPDGGRVAQPDEGGILLREVDGDGEVLLPTPGVDPYQLDWSPDGETLAFSDLSDQSAIWTMSVAGSQPRLLVELTDARAVGPQWAPDGQTIAFMEARAVEPQQLGMTPERFVLRLVAPDGTGLRDLRELGTCLCVRGPRPGFVWAPDGTAIAASQVTARPEHLADVRSDGLYVVTLDGAAERVAEDAAGTLAWRPVPEDG